MEQFLITWDKNCGTGVNFAVRTKKFHIPGTNFLRKGTILAYSRKIFDVEGTIFRLQGTFLTIDWHLFFSREGIYNAVVSTKLREEEEKKRIR